MRIYFSAKWQLQHVVRMMEEYFAADGHEIMSHWTERAFARNYERFGQSREFSDEEARAILLSDVLVHFSDLEGKGKYIDLGIALAGKILQKRPSGIYVLGEQTNESQYYFNSDIKRVITRRLFGRNFEPLKSNVLYEAKRLEERFNSLEI